MTDSEITYVVACVREDIHRFYTWQRWINVRQKVLEIDKFECQDCKKRGIYTRATTVHHNQFVKRHPDQALEIWYTFQGEKYRNLVSLCHDCHEARHGYRQREPKTPLTEERW